MKDITSWKVYQYTTTDGLTGKVLVGYNTSTGPIAEEVVSSSEGTINDYKLYGKHNHYFEGAEQYWTDYKTKHNINSVTDISNQY